MDIGNAKKSNAAIQYSRCGWREFPIKCDKTTIDKINADGTKQPMIISAQGHGLLSHMSPDESA